MLTARTAIAGLYSQDLAVIQLAASLLVFAGIFQFSDAIQVTAAGALRGYQDTRATMIITLLAPRGPAGLWQGLVLGLTCAAILLSVRLARSARRRIHSA